MFRGWAFWGCLAKDSVVLGRVVWGRWSYELEV